MKNFSNTKEVLVTTIPVRDAQTGMIDYTFLLPGKNDICKAQFLPESKKVSIVPPGHPRSTLGRPAGLTCTIPAEDLPPS